MGELTEIEANSFEEDFAQDSELAEQVQIVENELVDAFVKNQLTQKEAKLFETNYLTTEKRFEKLNFAKLFVEHLTEQTKPRTIIETVNHKSGWYQQLFTRLSFAGLIFIIIGSGIVYILFRQVNKNNVVNIEQISQSNVPENKENTNIAIHQESSGNNLVQENSKLEISDNQNNSVEHLKNKGSNKKAAHFQNTEKNKTQKPKINRPIIPDIIQKESADKTTNSLLTQAKNVENNIINNSKVENAKNNPKISESISVVNSNSTELTNTQDGSLGNNFKSDQIIQLPLESRNTADLLSLQPGITPEGNVAGGRSDQANITLNGVDVNEQQRGDEFFSVLRITPKELQEFRITTTIEVNAAENVNNIGLFTVLERTLQSKGEQIIEIAVETNNLILWLDLPIDTAKYQTYQMIIKTTEGNIIFAASNLKSPKIILPADKLQNANYVIFLGGVSSENTVEYIAKYTFRTHTYKQ